MARLETPRTPLTPAGCIATVAVVLLITVVTVFTVNMCIPKPKPSPTLSQQYPGPWVKPSADPEVARTLIRSGAANCGEFYMRGAVSSSSEYLVFCRNRDSGTWTAYQVWTRTQTALGPDAAAPYTKGLKPPTAAELAALN